jgi:uncharacterized protein (DUF697 family)
MIYILYAIVLVLVTYGLLVGASHLPFTGALLVVPLFLCMIMMMFIGHGKVKKDAWS